ncbi:Oidioi.mRNA.OKI2018_I69.XSR.g13445.t1.cds [Oikopleura dioica]|uniref:Oidioi.mRNA.OKI2018_I69.XSR.g13445.t1.cds n=1 Tax=Oikopleura dioica TaxID=34765 RepID=A0ABN7S6X1_OIKDI|nr:Oidioi.mRNA.OKI2018_I69.XSR.g13445.t1.cds [Oikopleura dioica]
MAVPKAYMEEMEQGKQNGVLHMCRDQLGMLEGEFYVFDSCSVENRGCNQIELQRDFSGSFFSSSTVVWDRQSSQGIRMPRPLKEVTCKVIVESVEQAIFPSVLNPMNVEDKPVEVKMTLWKTEFGIWPGIPASMAELPNGELSYIIGEVIHARIQPVLPLRRTVAFDGEEVDFNLNNCWLASPNDPSMKYLIISDNSVVPNPIVPVEIEASPTSYIGQDFEYNSKRALAFNFQVAIFRNGDPMKLICETSFKFDTVKIINSTRKRRGARAQKAISPNEIFTTDAEFTIYSNTTESMNEGLFGIENYKEKSILEEIKSKIGQKIEPEKILNAPEVRAVVQPGAYLSETLPKTKNLTLEDIHEDFKENTRSGWITIETLILLPILSLLIIAARMYRTYSLLERIGTFFNKKMTKKNELLKDSDNNEEFHPRTSTCSSEISTHSSSLEDETIHFTHVKI